MHRHLRRGERGSSGVSPLVDQPRSRRRRSVLRASRHKKRLVWRAPCMGSRHVDAHARGGSRARSERSTSEREQWRRAVGASEASQAKRRSARELREPRVARTMGPRSPVHSRRRHHAGRALPHHRHGPARTHHLARLGGSESRERPATARRRAGEADGQRRVRARFTESRASLHRAAEPLTT